MLTYICPDCGGRMKVIEHGDLLWCPKCGEEMDPMDYDFDDFEEPDYEADPDNEYGEVYDEGHDEIAHHLED